MSVFLAGAVFGVVGFVALAVLAAKRAPALFDKAVAYLK